MDDGFLPWNSTLDLNVLKNILNNLHPTIKFTVEPAKFDHFSKTLVINFLDITVLLHENSYVETDIFYKERNTHDYLNYDSQLVCTPSRLQLDKGTATKCRFVNEIHLYLRCFGRSKLCSVLCGLL